MYINEPMIKPTRKKKLNSQNLKIQAKLNNLKTLQTNNKALHNSLSHEDSNHLKNNIKIKARYLCQPDHESWRKKYQIEAAKTDQICASDYNERQFEKKLEEEIDFVYKKWLETTQYFKQKEIDFKVQQAQVEKQALRQCCHLLYQEFTNDQSAHNATMNLLIKKMLQVDDYKLRLKNQIFTLKKQNKVIQKQIDSSEKNRLEMHKKSNQRNTIKQQYSREQQNIKHLQQKILECKTTSYTQKEEFVNIQDEEFRMYRELQELEVLERSYLQKKTKSDKFKQLKALREKLNIKTDQIQIFVTPHLERKIHKMAELRANINKINQILQTCETKIQEQNYIIDGLKQKYQIMGSKQDSDDEQNMVSKYKKRYSQIYFSNGTSKADWNDYRAYINQLVGRNKKIDTKVLTEAHEYHGSGSHHQRRASIINNYDVDSSSSIGNNKINRGKTQSRFIHQKETKNIRSKKINLPRLIKMNGSDQKQIKKQLKNQLKNNISEVKNSDFQFESISNNESQVSGEIIQVQFHKKPDSKRFQNKY